MQLPFRKFQLSKIVLAIPLVFAGVTASWLSTVVVPMTPFKISKLSKDLCFRRRIVDITLFKPMLNLIGVLFRQKARVRQITKFGIFRYFENDGKSVMKILVTDKHVTVTSGTLSRRCLKMQFFGQRRLLRVSPGNYWPICYFPFVYRLSPVYKLKVVVEWVKSFTQFCLEIQVLLPKKRYVKENEFELKII